MQYSLNCVSDYVNFFCLASTILPRILAPVCLFEPVLFNVPGLGIYIMGNTQILCSCVLLYETATLTTSIVKVMYQFAYIDSYPTALTFKIVYLRQYLAFLIKYC